MGNREILQKAIEKAATKGLKAFPSKIALMSKRAAQGFYFHHHLCRCATSTFSSFLTIGYNVPYK
jgi:hypothetical protein